ncbi:hypothetical protein H920_10167 [Fukomys damarensis]|uniref:Uncharacterized protein n=1 Tax=Fukomys damarensis TaxID=885580 RepID=A0A091DZS1_FUKDA|nr:hypothetical protein H920_10167 [Fukomys damarensis]
MRLRATGDQQSSLWGPAPSLGPSDLVSLAGWQEASSSITGSETETPRCSFADCLISLEDFDKWRDKLLIPGCSREGGPATTKVARIPYRTAPLQITKDRLTSASEGL